MGSNTGPTLFHYTKLPSVSSEWKSKLLLASRHCVAPLAGSSSARRRSIERIRPRWCVLVINTKNCGLLPLPFSTDFALFPLPRQIDNYGDNDNQLHAPLPIGLLSFHIIAILADICDCLARFCNVVTSWYQSKTPSRFAPSYVLYHFHFVKQLLVEHLQWFPCP